ncbi:MAG TPA: UrcA family protein [Gammaproteobacteria bacterium]
MISAIRHRGMAGVLALAAGGLLGPAQAAPEHGTADVAVRSAVVRYDDLDLGTQAGVRALYERLEAAAARVCGPYALVRASARRFSQACQDDALTGAVQATGNAALAALHERERGTTRVPSVAAR